MNRYKKRLFFLDPIQKDIIFFMMVAIFISNFAEVIYDYFDGAVNSNIFRNTLSWILITIFLALPWFWVRFKNLQKYLSKKDPNIFISYSTNDQTIVESIKSNLDKYLDGLWWQNDLLPGENYKEEIENKITKAELIIIMFSKNYEESENIQNWELPLIISEENNREEVTIIPIVVGNYEGKIPFEDKYQVFPSRSNGLHRMLSSNLKKQIKEMSKMIKYQIENKTSFSKFEDSKAFKRSISIILGFLTALNLIYVFSSQNQIDNALDKALEFSNTTFELEQDVSTFLSYADFSNPNDLFEYEIIQHNNTKAYITLMTYYRSKADILGYEDEWSSLINSAYNQMIAINNFLIEYPDNYDIAIMEYEDYEMYVGEYIINLCVLLNLYQSFNDPFQQNISLFDYDYYELVCIETGIVEN